MTTITIDELQARLAEVIEQIQHDGEPVAITRDGAVVAKLLPPVPNGTGASVEAAGEAPAPRRWTEEERAAYWAEWDRIGREISKTWPKGVSAVDAVREQRREL